MNTIRIWTKTAGDAISARLHQIETHTMETIREALCLGSMAGSAAGSIVLFPSRTIWILDISTFGLSFGWFVVRHWKKFKAYGPLIFPPGGLLTLGVSVLSHVSPAGFLAWLPVVMLLFILLAVHSMPPLLPHLLDASRYQITLGNTLSILAVEPGSVQDMEDYVDPEDPNTRLLLSYAREQDLVHMQPTCRASPTPSSRDSDIDLENPQDQMGTSNIASARMVSEDAEELDARFSKSFWKVDRESVGQSLRYQGYGKERSSSPDSQAAGCHLSSRAESNKSLLD